MNLLRRVAALGGLAVLVAGGVLVFAGAVVVRAVTDRLEG